MTCALAASSVPVRGSAVGIALAHPRPAIRFAVLCNASIALTALAQRRSAFALLACTTFATMASYIALFHTAPLMAYNFGVAGAIGAFEVCG